MKQNDTQMYGISLKELDTKSLDKLMSNVLREMRNRDSNHVKKDVIESTQTLSKLRGSGKLP